MNREQKAAAVAEIAEQIQESDAVFAVDYRGISVTQIADAAREAARVRRRPSASSRTRSPSGPPTTPAWRRLKDLLTGPTALMFVRGDAASAAKTIATFNKETQLLEFKGGVMDGATLEVAQIQAIAKLPSRDVLYGQLVGMIAAPITGLARGLGGLIGGLAIALGDLQEKKESGEVPAGEAPAAPRRLRPRRLRGRGGPAEDAPADEAAAEEAPAAEAEAPAEEPGRGGRGPADEPAETRRRGG